MSRVCLKPRPDLDIFHLKPNQEIVISSLQVVLDIRGFAFRDFDYLHWNLVEPNPLLMEKIWAR
jgi:hypothetical protein